MIQFLKTAEDAGSDRLARLADVVRESAMYRWLTKEPEPDVIVIDLRETYTVGPFIRLLDATVETVRPYWESSQLKRGVDGVVSVGERAAGTRVGQLVVTVLEPPEPPKSERERADGGEDDREAE